MDFLIPGNEKELLARAKELGSEVIFLKEFKDKSEMDRYASPKGLLITSKKDLIKIRNLKQFVDLIVVISDSSEEFNRAIVETKGVDYVFNLASSSGRDHTHYRRGGVNQVIAKLMKEKGIKYGISFSRFLQEKQWRRIVLLGRWLFNARVLKKYNVPIEVFSLTDDPDNIRSQSMLKSFQRVIQQGI
tara:strand:+ start:46 stop:609 length:564 start_codon:yes stop_codon:yes gene_type:complete